MHGKRRKTISVTSGKGGVGKSSIVSNMAYLLGTMNEVTYILDADLALGNIDIMFGMVPKYNIKDFIEGKREFWEIVMKGPSGIKIIPATTGAYELSNLSDAEKNLILGGIRSIPDYDFMIIDTQAGLSSNVIYFNSISEDMFLIVTPDPASLADSYAVIKVLSKKTGRENFKIIFNMVKDESEALEIYKRFLSVTDKFLRVCIEFYGYIPLDRHVPLATKRQRLWTQEYPDSVASCALRDICLKLLKD
ncbi:MAG: MinD/ParA family protein [Deltaproteobacteria bacterium]|nr:MinD/ParA family protein [Deltaproteobacteria bacterium]